MSAKLERTVLFRRKLSIAFTIVTIVTFAHDGVAYSQRPSGSGYGISGGAITIGSSRQCSLQVPEQYQVLHIEDSRDRLLVTAYSVILEPGNKSKYHSEVWMFVVDRSTTTTLDFEDRKVLVEFETFDGESKQLCRRTVSGPDGIAVYIDGWENGRTLLFDREGAGIDVEWPKTKGPGDHCCVDYILPVAWVEEYSPRRRSRLVCRMNFHGDLDPYLLLLDLEGPTFESYSMSGNLGDLGEAIVNSMLRQEGAY